PFSRLGEWDADRIAAVVDDVDGFMIHNNCENGDLALFAKLLEQTEERFGRFFGRVRWISLGGGIHFTGPGYPVDAFCRLLQDFGARHGVQVYLEPGEAAVTRSTTLEVTVLDRLNNGKELAIVDS